MSQIVREFLEAILLALLVFFVIQVSVQNFRVEGRSMRPTLNGGEYLMVNKLAYFQIDMQRLARLVPFWDAAPDDMRFLPFAHPPSRCDVIVFHAPISPQRDFVKRVVGMPGETVAIREGSIYINGEQSDDPCRDSSNLTRAMECIPKLELQGCRLGADQYFVLGDNRGSSNDSRDWGPVSRDSVVGKVWFVYWPLSKLPLPFVEEDG